MRFALTGFLMCFAMTALAADDPNIPKDTKQRVLGAMSTYIEQMKVDNNQHFPIFDHTRQTVTLLAFSKLHQGVVRKGKSQLYVACADFADASGNKIDVDFFVNDRYEVVEAIVHKKAGEKFAYKVD